MCGREDSSAETLAITSRPQHELHPIYPEPQPESPHPQGLKLLYGYSSIVLILLFINICGLSNVLCQLLVTNAVQYSRLPGGLGTTDRY